MLNATEKVLPHTPYRASMAWLMMLLSLALTLLAWYELTLQNQRSAQQQFDLHVQEISDLINQRLRDHEQILLGGAGLFDASQDVSRDEWHAYVKRLDLAQNYPGILGVGYSEIIQPKDLEAHIQRVRDEGFPNYSVNPPGQRPLYSAIVYLEPFTGRNLAAFGYDMLSESTRAEAMRRAAETGKPTISSKVTLVQETHGKIQAGFLMYIPIYRKGQPLATPEQRWQALQGFVYSPYRVEDLMRGILGSMRLTVDFKIFDGREVRPAMQMYEADLEESRHDDSAAHFQSVRHIEAYQHDWTLAFYSRPDFEAEFASRTGTVILILGSCISGLLFALVWFLVNGRERALGLAHSMTEQIRQNEEHLRRSEERFQLAVRGSNDGIWDWDLISDSMYFSPRFLALLGYHEATIPQHFSFFENRLHPQHKSATLQAIRDHLEQGISCDITCQVQVNQGGWRWFRFRGEAVRDGQSRPIRMAGSLSDIQQQKLAEAALESSAQHTQAILDNVLDGIVTIDASGTLASCNPAAEQMFGYNAGELIGRHLRSLLTPTSGSTPLAVATAATGPAWDTLCGSRHELEGRRRNGDNFPLELALNRFQREGKTLYIAVIRDITEYKRVEKMKNEFVSTVSHELRTPLTSISGALSLVCGGALDNAPERMQELLQIARNNSLRLSLLINDLLDMDKVVSGQMTFNMERQPLAPLIQQAIDGNRNYSEQLHVRLCLRDPLPEVYVEVDALRLQQVLSNLLSNAAKFSPEGGEVYISVSCLAERVRVLVEDRGPGIPAGFHSRIFQKFSQADSSDTRAKGGTGLGLAISKELMERMGGVIGFDSVEGQGATFYIELPCTPADKIT